MHVASLELCKELYELSGWYTPDMFTYSKYHVVGSAKDFKHYETFRVEFGGPEDIQSGFEKDARYPAYDLGYLLRKLPPHQLVFKGIWFIATIDRENNQLIHAEAETPEDAAAKLCIELFKQGVLTKCPAPSPTNVAPNCCSLTPPPKSAL